MNSTDSEIKAELDLLSLDVALGRGRDIQVEVAKALTVAQENHGIEAKVICKTAGDLVDAMLMMAGKHAHDVGFRWNSREGVHELPNGSAVRICFEKTGIRP